MYLFDACQLPYHGNAYDLGRLWMMDMVIDDDDDEMVVWENFSSQGVGACLRTKYARAKKEEKN